MEIKKTPKADLENKKGIFFEVGLIVTLTVLLFVFERKTSAQETEKFQTVAEKQPEEEIIPITQHMMKPPPPPPPKPILADLIDIVENDQNLDENLEIQDIDDKTDNKNQPTNVSDFGEYGDEEGEANVFMIVEDMPVFPGNVTTWISKNTKYPQSALENNVEGKVFVKFVIEKDGSITNVEIIKSVDAALDKEASRVIRSMPKWTPGKQRGKPVRVSYTLPINFQLQR